MVAGVHGRTADLGALAQPAAAAGLATGLVLVLDVTDLAERGLAADVNPAQLAARHPDHGVIALFRQQLSTCAGGPDQLTAATEGELDVVHGRTHRDVLQRERVADPDGRLRPRLDRVANLQADWSEDVALLSILVVDERDPGAAVGVVLDGRDLPRDAVLVALEVDLPVDLPVAPTLVARRDAALVVAAGVRRQRLEQGFLGRVGGDLVEAGDRHEATAGAGGLELSYRHCFLDAPEQPFDLLTLAQRHDRLLPVGGSSDGTAAGAAEGAALLATHRHGVDPLDLDVLRLVLLLERLLDLGLRCGGKDLERVAALGVELVRALCDHGADHDLGGGFRRHQVVSSSSLRRGRKFSSSSSMASFVRRGEVWVERSRWLWLCASTIFAPARVSNGLHPG